MFTKNNRFFVVFVVLMIAVLLFVSCGGGGDFGGSCAGLKCLPDANIIQSLHSLDDACITYNADGTCFEYFDK